MERSLGSEVDEFTPDIAENQLLKAAARILRHVPGLDPAVARHLRIITDRLHGDHTEVVDDVVLRRGDGTPAYNLVVVVDDAAQGVGEVVRADDLLSSTPRHAHLQALLGLPEPSWAHVPLVLASDGDRLAKRHGAVTLDDRLALGDTPGRVTAVLARSLGLEVPEPEMWPADLLSRFQADQIGLSPWTLSPAQTDEPW